MTFDDKNARIFLSYLLNRPQLLLTTFERIDDIPTQLFPNVLEVAESLHRVDRATHWLNWKSPTDVHTKVTSSIKLHWKQTIREIIHNRSSLFSLKFTLGESTMLFQLVDSLLSNCPSTTPPSPSLLPLPTLPTINQDMSLLNQAITDLRLKTQKASSFLQQKEGYFSAIKLLIHLETVILKCEEISIASNLEDVEVQTRISDASNQFTQSARDLCGVLDWCFRHQVSIIGTPDSQTSPGRLVGEIVAELSIDRLQSATQVFNERLNDSLQHLLSNITSKQPDHLQREIVELIIEAITANEYYFSPFLSPQILQKLDTFAHVLSKSKGDLQVLGYDHILTHSSQPTPDDPQFPPMLLFQAKFEPQSKLLLADYHLTQANFAWNDMLASVEAMNESYKTQIKSTGISQAAKLIRLQEQLERAARYEYTKEAVEDNRDEKEADFRELFNLTPFEGPRTTAKTSKGGQTAEEKETLNKVTQRFNTLANHFWSHGLASLSLRLGLPLSIDISPDEFIDSFLHLHSDRTSLSSDSKLFQSTIKNCLLTLTDHRNTIISRIDVTRLPQSPPLMTILHELFLQKKTTLSAFNFYEPSTDLQYAKRFVASLNSMAAKLATFHNNPDFSELFSLKSLLKAIRSISDMKLNSSLSDICGGLETLLRTLEEFNFTLPTPQRLQTDADNLKLQLLELRRLEKHKWKDFVLIKRNELMNEDIGEVSGKLRLLDADLGVKARLKIFDDVISKSSLLNFSQRMVLLLNTLSIHSPILPKTDNGMDVESPDVSINDPTPNGLMSLQTDPTKRTLVNLLVFYASFYPEVSDKIKALEPQIEEPMKNSMKLMNWHFEDLINLKMNVEKLYRGIHRTVKAQKELLDVGVAVSVILPQRSAILFTSLGEAHANFDAALFVKPVKSTMTSKTDIQIESPKQMVNKTSFMSLLSSSPDFTNHFNERDLSFLKLISASKIVQLFSISPKKTLPKFKNNMLFKDDLSQLMRDYMQRLNDLTGEKKRSFVARALVDFSSELVSFGLKKRFNFQHPNTISRLFEVMQVIDVSFLDKPNRHFRNRQGIGHQSVQSKRSVVSNG